MSTTPGSGFDPLQQNITILDRTQTPFNVSIADINYEAYYTLSASACYAVQLGAAAVMLMAVLLLTRKPGNQAIFILNVASLVLCCISRLIFIIFFGSNFNTFYALNTYDYSYVRAADNALVTIGAISSVFLTATINLSLVLQVHGITRQSHFKPWINKTMIGISAFLFFFSLTFRTIMGVENILEIYGQSNFVHAKWLTRTVLVSELVTILWFCGIFTGKLVMMLWVRSKTIWGRQVFLEVIVIGLFYTMFIPTIFAIIQMARVRKFPEAGSFYLALTAILLPLTSLWAQNVKQGEVDTKRSKDAASNRKYETLWSDPDSCPNCGIGSKNTSVSTTFEHSHRSARNMSSSRRESRPTSDYTDDVDIERALRPGGVNVTNTVIVESRAL
ncbi:hypothetical protein GLAREA_00606 [Glarea lozoyensis ATCC 20868]|uniref:Pheromone alpha factor receptor n=1 Tax=Glarea lozoyensis (strain ATCC 20868 / MF5171) TaxID=1116229 RepID=S3DBU4_GLAL2|nr:uncharacterized protein GLAREA_00606 [Glarea lozoyensis ATCC 20868]EPE29446.1 hypothetical protein GLAREA_00606 [Glarea lozoyensis ATCC 20868]